MQQIIRERLKQQTLVTIAHKLHTILDYDLVAVLDSGMLVEFDAPRSLLHREGSLFKVLFESCTHEKLH
jgi:ATP-binding cassette subfamily C (CFTR/MRP) protein 1